MSVFQDAGPPEPSLLIVDEVHNVGSPTFSSVLRADFIWRLGLSATPVRYFDEEGTDRIKGYFGDTVYSYGLKEALQDGRLCQYQYFVYPAYLDDSEYAQYVHLTNPRLCT